LEVTIAVRASCTQLRSMTMWLRIIRLVDCLDFGKLDGRLEDKIANLTEEITRHLLVVALHHFGVPAGRPSVFC
jgi:hypothetical protein